MRQFGPAVAAPSFTETSNSLSGISADTSGDVVLAGSTLGDFSGKRKGAGTSMNFLAKYDSSGNQLWVNEFGTGEGDYLNSVKVAATGEIVAGGGTLGAYPGFSNANHTAEGAVFKTDSAGNLEWVNQFSLNSTQTIVTSVAVLTNGDVYAAGNTLDSGDTQAIFFCRLDGSTGNVIWQAAFGTHVFNTVSAIAVDASGNLLASGSTLGRFPGTVGGTESSYLLKLDPSGNVVWTQPVAFTDSAAGIVSALTVDSANDVLIAGTTLNEGVTSQPSFVVGFGAAADARCFVAKYDGASGTEDWSQAFGSMLGDQLTGIATDTSNHVIVAGFTNGTFAAVFEQPMEDIALFKFSTSGENEWVQQIGTGPLTNGSIPVGPVVTIDGSNNIFLGAGTQGAYPGYSNPSNDIEMFISKFGP